MTHTSLVSVDVLTLAPDPELGILQLALAPREWEPFRGQLALPGVLLGSGERLRHAALRALEAKLGAGERHVRAVGQLVTFDEPARDPRGPTLSIAMWAIVGSMAFRNPNVLWSSMDEVPPLAFDHNRIIEDCRPALASKLWRDLDFTRAMLGPRFRGTDAWKVQSAITGSAGDRSNFNQMLSGVRGLQLTDEYEKGSVGRPSRVWTWDPNVTSNT
jgi:8-oxo-dGTP diphosphatase